MKLCSGPAPYLTLSLLGCLNPKHTKTLRAASGFLLFDFKEAAAVMKVIERQAYFRTGRSPHGTDLPLSKPARGTLKMLHPSFEKTKLFFSESDLQYIAQDILTTLRVEQIFAGMRTPSRATPDMRDNGSRRPSRIVESVHTRYITLLFQCIADPKVATRNEQ